MKNITNIFSEDFDTKFLFRTTRYRSIRDAVAEITLRSDEDYDDYWENEYYSDRQIDRQFLRKKNRK